MPLRHRAMAALEAAKDRGECENPLEARLVIYADDDTREFLQSFGQLETLMIVSLVELKPIQRAPAEADGQDIYIAAEKNTGDKCERCWMLLESVNADERYEGLCARCAERVATLHQAQD